MSYVKDWCFTLNNYTDGEVEDLKNSLEGDGIKYAVFGYEVAESGTPHLQGFLSLTKRKRFTAVKSIVHERAHIEPRKGTKLQAIEYCKKDDNYVEFGDVSMANGNQGGRSDLAIVGDMVKEGESLAAICEAHPTTYIKYHKGIVAAKVTLAKPYKPNDLRGLWFYGKPGSGKTRFVHDTFPDIYLKQQNKWWDNYQGEKYVLLDDLDTDVLAHHLKIWADRYPASGEVKGGTVNLEHDYFIVTSNFRPFEIFSKLPQDTIDAIERRFTLHEVRLDFTVEEGTSVDEGVWTIVVDPPFDLS